jgi:subtilisin family serine protease
MAFSSTSLRLTLSALVAATAVVSSSSTTTTTHVHEDVHRQLRAQGKADVVISFKKNTANALESFEAQESSFFTRGDKIEAMIHHLETEQLDTQQEVLEILFQESSAIDVQDVKTFWITSNLYVNGASEEFINQVRNLPSVEEIRAPKLIQLSPTEEEAPGPRPVPVIEWGVQKVQAPEVWGSGFNGQNIIVGNIDTGVLSTHEALRSNFIGEYGWFDPENKTATPYDNWGHGTHVMGTIAGQNGIGVAPGAKWMACKGCRTEGCPEEDLLACAQFITCPTDTDGNNKNCKKAPHVINNSWGGGQGDNFYRDAVEAWLQAGIVPVFSQGNDGPECGTANSPADMDNVIGVGATTITDGLASLSSKGPAVNGLIKPDISAPGHRVRSSVPSSDDAYGVYSGTSMAAPHVTGVIALLLSARPGTSIGDVKKLLYGTTDTATLQSTNYTCGGIPENVYPNNQFGYGRINARSAIYGQTVLPTPAPTKKYICSKFPNKVLCTASLVCKWEATSSSCVRRWNIQM